MSEKGFIFTLDAFVGLIILTTVFSLLPYALFQDDLRFWSTLEMKRQADDLIVALDKSGVLDSFNESEIESSVSAALSPSFEMRISLERYEFSGGTFNLQQTHVIGASVPENKNVAKGRRVFMTFSNERVDEFVNAEYWVWLK